MKLSFAELNSKNFYVILNTITAMAERNPLLSTGDNNATFSLIRSLQIFLYLPTGNTC